MSGAREQRPVGCCGIVRSARRPSRLLRFVMALSLGVSWCAVASDRGVTLPAPVDDNPVSTGPAQSIVLSGGCFWGVQGVFEHLRGVQRAVAGYAGGARGTAHYDEVGLGNTGHAESVQITFDPAKISLGRILQVFFSVVHDPTQVNRQGPDVGSQYRSEIFYSDDAQRRIAEHYIAQLAAARVFPRPIATRVDPLPGFYPAEEYHQDFLLHHPAYPYIVYNDLPKIDNLRHLFPDEYRDQPVRLSGLAAR